MNVRIGMLSLLLAGFASVHAGELLTSFEAVTILKKMGGAARAMNYSGVYAYRHGDTMESFRLTHVFDASGEQERRESLEGPLREFIRSNDQIVCYTPDTQPLQLDRKTANKFFPGVMADQVTDVLTNYNLRRAEMDRVAGYDCQSIILEPKDKLRNAHKMCIEPSSGMLLKTAMYSSERKEPLEQFSFLQLDIGGNIDKRLLKSTLASRALPSTPLASSSAVGVFDSHLDLRNVPSGFRLLKQSRSDFPTKPNPVTVYVFTDGVAIVSVFVEPTGNGPLAIPISQGPLNVYSRQQNGWMVTALGEVPPITVQLFTQALVPH